jgi:hypothetical protein
MPDPIDSAQFIRLYIADGHGESTFTTKTAEQRVKRALDKYVFIKKPQ